MGHGLPDGLEPTQDLLHPIHLRFIQTIYVGIMVLVAIIDLILTQLYYVYVISIEAGLPNITSSGFGHILNARSRGAIIAGGTSTVFASGAAYLVYLVSLDASLSNSIYGSSKTVSPLSQSTLYILKY